MYTMDWKAEAEYFPLCRMCTLSDSSDTSPSPLKSHNVWCNGGQAHVKAKNSRHRHRKKAIITQEMNLDEHYIYVKTNARIKLGKCRIFFVRVFNKGQADALHWTLKSRTRVIWMTYYYQLLRFQEIISEETELWFNEHQFRHHYCMA